MKQRRQKDIWRVVVRSFAYWTELQQLLFRPCPVILLNIPPKVIVLAKLGNEIRGLLTPRSEKNINFFQDYVPKYVINLI